MRLHKGQMVFEFLIAAVLFIGIILFVLNTLNTNVSIYTGDYYRYNIEGKAVAASEALVKITKGIGLAKEWPVLDSARVSALNTRCGTFSAQPEKYLVLLQDLNLLDKPFFTGTGLAYDVRIEVNQTAGGQLLLCEPPNPPKMPGNVTSSRMRRFGILDTGQIVELTLWVW